MSTTSIGSDDDPEQQPITSWPPDSPSQSQSPDSHENLLNISQSVSHKHKLVDISEDKTNFTKCKKICPEKLEHEESIDFADIALIKWWKRQRSLDLLKDINPSLNAYSKMNLIARSKEGHQFMSKRVKKMISEQLPSQNPRLFAAIGTFYEKLHDLEKAEKYLCKAVHLDPEVDEHKWLLARICKQAKVLKAQRCALENFTKNERIMQESSPVTRVHVDDLSFHDFFVKYAMTSTPVIVTAMKLTEDNWTLEHIRQKAGNCTVTPKKLVKESIEWAKLENAAPTTVGEYINSLQGSDHQSYLFDWSLPQYAPMLAEELTIPKYFAGDFLQRTDSGHLYRDTWPSLFIAPKGLKSELHVDTFASNFWMYLMKGQKRWIFFGKEDVPLLYPRYPQSMDPSFEVDLMNPDFDKHPLLSLVTPKECILEAGEILFVPSGCPHYVENLSESIAISANFVDASNIKEVLQELAINGLTDPRAQELHSELRKKCDGMLNVVSDDQGKEETDIVHNITSQNTKSLETEELCSDTKSFLQQWMDNVESAGNLKWFEFKKKEMEEI